MLTELSDEQLMKAYANANFNAFEVLYGRYKTPLYRFILRQAPPPAIAEELFQDVWTKIINTRERYTITASFRTYLYQVARNTLIDHFRRQSIRAVEATCDDPLPSQNPVPAPAPWTQDPSHTLDNYQRYHSILEAMNTLPKEQREAFLLKVEAELPLAEIAEITKVNAETAKSRYRYAVKQLKQLLGQNHDYA